MRATNGFSVIVISLLLLFTASTSFAQSDQGNSVRVFGLGQPVSARDLPPGQLRNKLESLPPQASSKALRWLQEISFPETDLETIQIDNEGGVFYGDTLLPDPERMENAEAAAAPGTESAPASTLDDAFRLHSKPGAPNVVYIDFDGATISGTAWNGTHSTLLAKPYNPTVSNTQPDAAECNDPLNFCDRERTAIIDIWHRVAEDLAPYNIDVTTERPATFDPYTGTILVTHSIDETGKAINCTSCGGVAYVNVFGRSNYHTYYSPALVFWDKLSNGNPTYNAEASSHEFGHNLGLSHDGAAGTTYYAGQGSGLVSWAPIMGNSYYNNVTQWNNGDYSGATQTQNDLAIIDGKLGYDTDDHGNNTASATALDISETGQVVSSNPELDPHNVLNTNKGVINSSSDVDVFSIASGAGTINLTVTPSWDAFYNGTSRRGSNLDIEAELQDLNGNPIVTIDPTNNTNAVISASVSAGTYHLAITGVGNGDPLESGYSDYNSMGQYFINGSVSPAAADETAPEPNPMGWASVPASSGQSSIAMTALTATDETSAVEYSFFCVAGGTDCENSDSGWQSSASHSATGLAASTQYTFQVRARDQAGNETGSSASASATTDTPPLPPAAPSGLSATGTSETTISLGWTDNAGDETGYRVERSAAGQNNYSTIANLSADVESYGDSGRTASTTYDYQVYAVNGGGDSAAASASGTTQDPPPPPPYVNFTADSGTLMAGTESGGLSSTYTEGDGSHNIRERESGGRKSGRHSYFEYRWNFNVSEGDTVTVYAVARSGGSTDGDTFDFEYSLNGGSTFAPVELFNVSTSVFEPYSGVIPGAPSGQIMIRVVDTDQGTGNRSLDTVYVDHLFIQVGAPSLDPPIGNPSDLNASPASSSSIDLTWTDGTDNESGFTVEHSPTAAGDWVLRDTLAAGSNSYTDNGLLAETTYYYRVQAFNNNDVSAFTTANATTPEALPLSLSANGRKVKGVKHIDLEWSGAASVDVYRNGGTTPIASDIAGSTYGDNTGSKGSGTYTHKVCVAGTDTCSNTTTVTF